MGRNKVENNLAIVSTTEDLVIIVREECSKCSDNKLGILKLYQLDDNDIRKFVKLGVRRVRVSCDCKYLV